MEGKVFPLDRLVNRIEASLGLSPGWPNKALAVPTGNSLGFQLHMSV